MVQQELDSAIPSEHDEIRILLIGDPGVGKTSLIYNLVNDEFDSNVPARMADIIVPAHVTSENVPLHITDYSEREQSHDELTENIREAHVICIVYVAGDDDCLDRVPSYWVPTVRKCLLESKSKPMILVANKVDLVKEGKSSLEKVTSVLQDCLDFEAFIEVSAFVQKNVVQLFSCAQKAILYPLAPLFDPQMRVLTKKCRNALADIFKLCDHDEDGLLSDYELNLFQENCFGTPLQRDALDDLKSIIEQSIMDGIKDNGLTQIGFLFLHTLSIDKGRHDFTWQVLRKFNYDDQINAKKEESTAERIELSDRCSPVNSISDSQDNTSLFNSSSLSNDDDDNIFRLDLTWAREHSDILKVGLGVTIATLISMLALKYLVLGGSRNST